MRRNRLAAALLAAAVVAGGAVVAVSGVSTAQQAGPPAPGLENRPVDPSKRAKVDPRLQEKRAAGEDPQVMITFAGDREQASGLARAFAAQNEGTVHTGTDRVIGPVSAFNLEALARNPNVVAVDLDELLAPAMADEAAAAGVYGISGSLHSQGHDGDGMMIGFIDSGIVSSTSGDHDSMVGKWTYEFCDTNVGHCPLGDGSTGAGAAFPVNCTGNGHGTHVGSIALSNNATYKGWAPDADGIMANVFANTVNGCRATTSAILDALDWYINNINASGQWTPNGKPIAAINLSIAGSTTYADVNACSAASGYASFQSKISTLRSKGVSVVIAAGNDSATNGMSFPACVNESFSVGNANEAGGLSPSTNVSPYTDVHGWGHSILGADYPGTFGYYAATGTSSAAPGVASVLTLLREAQPTSTVTQREDAVEHVGAVIADSRTGGTTQVRALNAVVALSALTNVFMTSPSSKFISNAPASTVGDTGATGYGGYIGAGQTRTFNMTHVTGWANSRVKAAWLQVFSYSTASAGGYITLWSALDPMPTASVLNPTTSALNVGTMTNSVLARVDSEGVIKVYSSVGTHFRIDVTGYIGAGASDFVPINPVRIQTQAETVGSSYQTPVIAGQTIGGVAFPANTDAVIASVSVVSPSAWVAWRGCKVGCSDTLNVNTSAAGHHTVKTGVFELNANGRFVHEIVGAAGATATVAIDVHGYTTGTSTMVPYPNNANAIRLVANGIGPCRHPSTGVSVLCSTWGANTQIDLQLAGEQSIPANAIGVFGSVDVWSQSVDTFVAAWQRGVANPGFYQLFLDAGQDHNESHALGLGNGKISLYNSASPIAWAYDVQAYFAA